MTKSMWMAEDSSYSYGLFPWFSALIEMDSFSPWRSRALVALHGNIVYVLTACCFSNLEKTQVFSSS